MAKAEVDRAKKQVLDEPLDFAEPTTGHLAGTKKTTGAVVGSTFLGTVGAMIGTHIGVAGAFGAVSGLWPLLLVGAVFGGVAGHVIGGRVSNQEDRELDAMSDEELLT